MSQTSNSQTNEDNQMNLEKETPHITKTYVHLMMEEEDTIKTDKSNLHWVIANTISRSNWKFCCLSQTKIFTISFWNGGNRGWNLARTNKLTNGVVLKVVKSSMRSSIETFCPRLTSR